MVKAPCHKVQEITTGALNAPMHQLVHLDIKVKRDLQVIQELAEAQEHQEKMVFLVQKVHRVLQDKLDLQDTKDRPENQANLL